MFFLIWLIVIVAILLAVKIYFLYLKFKLDEEYKTNTGKTPHEVYNDKGTHGEYITYMIAKELPGYKKFLFNCYLPKIDNTTTEVDLIMLHTSGIYVLETKNYTGWIFGSEYQPRWTQTIKAPYSKVSKFHFLNPLIQNEIHVKELRRHIQSIYCNLPIYSIIVFGDSCDLMNIDQATRKHVITQHYNLYETLEAMIYENEGKLTENEINLLYSNLFEYTQADERTKREHASNAYLSKM